MTEFHWDNEVTFCDGDSDEMNSRYCSALKVLHIGTEKSFLGPPKRSRDSWNPPI